MKSLIFSSWPAIWVRSVTRRLGVNRIVARWLDRGDYEQAFNQALLAAIRPGDTVWDVGANVGHYTLEFADATGRTGCVMAFEPVPACFGELQLACRDLPHVRLQNIALGSKDHVASISLAEDPLGVTHSLSNGDVEPPGKTTVTVRTAKSIIGEMPDVMPSVVKIDVEGYEEAVLQGFGALLAEPRIQAIGVEVHFGVLEKGGDRLAPQRIEKILESSGFHLRWTDRSHIVATRR